METNKDKLISYLKYLGKDVEVEAFDSRFSIQKIAFILKSMGLELSYEFIFHHYGVYSKELTNDYYDSKDSFNNYSSNHHLSDKEEKILTLFKKTIDMDHSLLESVSTILYFNLVYSNIDNTIKEVKKRKPHLSDYGIILGINKAKELIFKDEDLTVDIKKELEMWDFD
ncbi:hypothetical protein OXIME_000613 [Oxyplasma meridianum]|uniref:Uncharacterized protein n=1 Tax=Oxyplasma meridianum TaxID=3073602 RepID=A0AAX4NF28_9ARCH